MSATIRTIYQKEPRFPASDQHPDAVRYRVGAYWVDAIGGEPTLAEVETVVAPTREQIDTRKRATVKAMLTGDSEDAIFRRALLRLTKPAGVTASDWLARFHAAVDAEI